MTSFVLDHSRQECLQGPKMGEGIYAKSPYGSFKLMVHKNMQNDVLINILWLEIDDELSLHNASVVDKHSGLTDL